MAKQAAVRFIARRNVRIVIACAAALVVIAACAALLFSKRHETATVSPAPGTSETVASTSGPATKTQKTNKDAAAAPASDVDPATLTSIAIQALGINVFYSKGTPGFEYEIKKTADDTRYVEFTAQELIGTKCTDDEGLFASVIQNPTSTEDQTTVSQTVSAGGKTYGLSLAGPGCTADASLLEQYQTGFKNGFGNLQAL